MTAITTVYAGQNNLQKGTTMDRREPTGTVVEGRDGPELLIHRTLPHAVEEVWAWLTDPEFLGRWYGTWVGDRASGTVELTMLEDPGHPGTCRINRCDAPTELAVLVTDRAGQVWDLQVMLERSGEGTRLTFRQPLGDFVLEVGDIGPGWEYYLDRLAAGLAGRAVDEITFDAYHPYQVEHYRSA